MILCACLLNRLAQLLCRNEPKLGPHLVAPRETIFDLERSLERSLAEKLGKRRRVS